MAEFKVGDRVRQVDRTGPGTVGQEFTVTGTGYDCGFITLDGGDMRKRGWFPHRFEAVPVAAPEAPREFQVGDMVTVAGQPADFPAVVKVVHVAPFGIIVEYEGGWPDARYGSGRYWHADNRNVTLAPPAPEDPLASFKAQVAEVLRDGIARAHTDGLELRSEYVVGPLLSLLGLQLVTETVTNVSLEPITHG